MAEFATFYALFRDGRRLSPQGIRTVMCQGNACDVITVVWNGALAAYVVENRSDRHVRLKLSTAVASFELIVRAHETRTLVVSSFDLPFRADFTA